jgi:type VI protein secretion system component VasF
MLGRQAYRCRTCRQRFYCSAFEEPRRGSGFSQKKRGVKVVDFRRRNRMMRRVVTVVVFVVMFSLFGLFLRHISQDHLPQSNTQDTGSPNE